LNLIANAEAPDMELVSVAEKLFARANKIPGMRGVLEFRLGEGSVVSVTVADTVTVGTAHPNPDVTVTMSADDFATVAAGEGDLARMFTSGKIRVDGDLGLATLLPQAIGASLSEEQDDDSGDEVNVDEQRYPAPERYAESITAAQPPLEKVERYDRDDLTPEDFYHRYILPCKPVVLTNALRDWPLYNMSREESLIHFEGLQGMIRAGDYVSKTFSRNRTFRAESMAAFVRAAQEYSATDDSEPPPYLGSNTLPESLETLIRWPDYFRNDQYIPPRIWIGPKGTVTPLHRDDTDNLFTQVWGEKVFILAAPHERPRLYAWTTYRKGGLEGSEVDAENPDYQKHPDARGVNFLYVQVGPGEMLFIPDGWFHHVRSLSLSLSVNFWTTSARHSGEC